jgi:hypothetical protein
MALEQTDCGEPDGPSEGFMLQSASKSIVVVSQVIVTVLLVFVPTLSRSQAPEDRRVPSLKGCGHRGLQARTESENRGVQSFLLSERWEDSRICEGSSADRNDSATSPDAPVFAAAAAEPDQPPLSARLLSRPALRDIGEEGTNISRAREGVLAVLQEENSCSAWFRQSDPQIDQTFSSLSMAVDEDGSNHVVRELDDRGVLFEHGPYIARSFQRGGRGSNISINANVAFFRARGNVYKILWPGGMQADTGQWRHLHVGPFDGGTLPAQIISLLHELAHVVGAIPHDDSSSTGLAISQHNTELILERCKAAANRAERPAAGKLLSKSLN